jgi:hypothetical protein
MAPARPALSWRLVPSATAPALGIAVIQRVAIAVASPSFAVVVADNFAFEVDIVVSPAMT